MKAQIPRRARNPQSKATKTFHAKKALKKGKERIMGERQKEY